MYDEYGNPIEDSPAPVEAPPATPAPDPWAVDGAQGAGPLPVDPWAVDGAQAGPTVDGSTPTSKTWGEIVGTLGTQAANAIMKRYTPNGVPDWGSILKDGTKAALAYNAYQRASQPTPPTGYQGGIPKYQADRYTVPTQAGVRPGAGGQRYFTDTSFATPAGLPAAQAAMQVQRTQLAQQNQQAQPVAPAQPPRDPNSDAFYGRQPVQGMAAGGTPGRYLQGKTDGMADKIPAQIDGVQPAALAHGEFVIPADVVSHLGNGNSDAGAQQLYKMMDKIRQARTGNKKQGKQIDPDKFSPGGIAKLAAGGTVQHFVAGGEAAHPSGTIGTESNLSNWVGPYVTDMLGKGQALSETPYHAYQGPLTAGDSPLQAQAFNNASNLAVPGTIGQAATTAGQVGSQMGSLNYQAPTTTAQQVSTQGFTQPGLFCQPAV